MTNAIIKYLLETILSNILDYILLLYIYFCSNKLMIYIGFLKNNDYIYMTLHISGPINVVRLEGNTGNIRKVIYLFMDMHVPETVQTKCDDENSIMVRDFFKKSFTKLNDSDKIYDFFVEYQPQFYKNVPTTKTYHQNIYMFHVIRFFKKFLEFDYSKNKTKLSNYFKNVRFHFVDIRHWLSFFIDSACYYLLNKIDNMTNKNDISVSLSQFIDRLKDFKDTLRSPIAILESQVLLEDIPPIYDTINDKLVYQKIYDKINYLVYKFLNNYKYPNIKKFVNMYINSVIIPNLDEIIIKLENLLNEFNDNIYMIDNQTYKILKEKILSIYEEDIIYVFAEIMDMYFLRRFLDKDYITNAIVYVGAAHAANYVSILVNVFGFKITHVSHAITKDIEKLNMFIKNINPFEEQFNKQMLNVMSILKQDTTKGRFSYGSAIQCSDISDFPKNFE
ncbi:hypothetical protein QJ857_gp1011 [Tupanvirus soda lake]|uniref:Uncharacterized protein n=2 Tax=Tupanvirus TaxID=2094720 RepID=A0A6N1NUC8_9VIRU|nr:hypothetical protein QJ857_gp1011 [Tupanvirus soda lake]QKU35043.1 hypothetical protein [Tupanvirus soda lake]